MKWQFKKLHRLAALIAVVVALQATGVWAQVGGFSSRDARFLREAALLGMFEFELGQLAMSRGPTQEIRDCGLLEAADHSGINAQLEETPAFHGIDLPTTLTRSQQRTLDRLNKLADTNSDKFVRMLLNQSIRSHRRNVQLYQRETANGQSGIVTDFSSEIYRDSSGPPRTGIDTPIKRVNRRSSFRIRSPDIAVTQSQNFVPRGTKICQAETRPQGP